MPVLSDEVREKIRAYLPRYPRKQAVTLPALHLVHDELRYVSPEAIVEIAELLDLHPPEVQDTMTFYQFFKETEADRLGEKLKKGSFDLQDFVDQMRSVRKMGPLGQLVQMLPGFNKIKMQLDVDNMDEGFFGQAEAIVMSMTPWERRHPERIDGKRRKRIARGSGTSAQQVNQLLKQFFEARKIAKSLSSGKFPALPGMRQTAAPPPGRANCLRPWRLRRPRQHRPSHPARCD